ncbi:hypothetical protein [Shewanella aestuarii]|uniref:Uncharacterized protein n=1 Tax=Shewanella aestuarii TaxID=1028752 RepID=A0A6G9QI96_9GAMM|nr:hypothetical protein [Shewanella aestuarii]QIR14284.1 hypothetical protein HBH39_07110 [Shewanella aestuarii]
MDKLLKQAMSIEPTFRHADTCEFIYQLSTRKQEGATKVSVTLIDRNPLKFWRVTSIILFISLVISLVN